MPLGVHASGSHLGGAGVDMFPRFIQAHTCSHAFGQMRQITSMVFEGVPERFPKLKLAFLEAGCGWAPYWMERMDDEYAKRAAEAPALKKEPSAYCRSGNIFFSCEADEWLLPQALKLVGENQIVYASDFPHWDNSYPGIHRRDPHARRHDRGAEAEGARRQLPPALRPLEHGRRCHGPGSPLLSRRGQARQAGRRPGRHPGGGPGLRDHRHRGEAGARGEAAPRPPLREGEGHALPGAHQSSREPLPPRRGDALQARPDAPRVPGRHGQAGGAAGGRRRARSRT